MIEQEYSIAVMVIFRHIRGIFGDMKKNKLKSLDKYVIFSISILLIFTIVEFVVSTITGIEHSTLCTCVFSAWGGEILSCALIKIFKLKSGDNGVE